MLCLIVILRPFPLFVDVMIFSVSITLCFIGVSIVWVEPFVTSNDPAPVTRIFNLSVTEFGICEFGIPNFHTQKIYDTNK